MIRDHPFIIFSGLIEYILLSICSPTFLTFLFCNQRLANYDLVITQRAYLLSSPCRGGPHLDYSILSAQPCLTGVNGKARRR